MIALDSLLLDQNIISLPHMMPTFFKLLLKGNRTTTFEGIVYFPTNLIVCLSQNSPDVDDEGYSIRPGEQGGNILSQVKTI